MDTTDTAAVFAAAATAAHWTRTNCGPRTEIRHTGHTYTVELPADGAGQARITGCHGYGGGELLDIPATWSQTAGIVDAAMAALSPAAPDPAPPVEPGPLLASERLTAHLADLIG